MQFYGSVRFHSYLTIIHSMDERLYQDTKHARENTFQRAYEVKFFLSKGRHKINTLTSDDMIKEQAGKNS